MTETEQTTNIYDAHTETTTLQGGVSMNDAEYLFSIVKSHKASLRANITDNFLENNTAIQDHISFSPVTITLSGFVGENVLKSDEAESKYFEQLQRAKEQQKLDDVTNKLGALSILAPQMSNFTQKMKNKVEQVYTSIRRYSSVVERLLNSTETKSNLQNKLSKFTNSTNATMQKQDSNIVNVYEEFQYYFFNRMPSSVYTPWGTYDDMYIQSLDVSQDEQKNIIDISVTYKQLSFANVEYGKVNETVRATYNEQARAEQENCGKTNSNWYDKYRAGSKYENKK